jgi:hypothetical protein
MVISALIILLVCFAARRLILNRAVATLSVEQKAMLVDASASITKRPWFYVMVIVLLVIWAIASANFGHRNWLLIGFVILLLAIVISTVVFRLRRLSAIGLPATYLRSVRLSTAILFIGVVIYLAATVYNVVTFVPK